jgi:hypothetical protein
MDRNKIINIITNSYFDKILNEKENEIYELKMKLEKYKILSEIERIKKNY